MFSKQEQRSWIKIDCARGRTARQCHQSPQEACGESALPYRTVARWVKAFNAGRQNVADQVVLVLEKKCMLLPRYSVIDAIRFDNARPHAAQAVADLFDPWGWEVLHHPPYSPDLSPCDFDFIPKMKESLRGIRFRTLPEILQAVDRSIRTINTTGAAKGILQLPHPWQRLVHNAGDYIEGQ
ncbi:hypothetical protein AVEN_189821-1 [Araneus ventricosus]|uniref:Mos1 transposase HTH domain-containing protein n=1 Tax=Araneus ventricosus TaxID=182803 RepID=A0A4Y2NP58_ARAVE|nr:hypothetical protein AVEN_189821-1 [Araneus ventricosus]